MLKYFSDNVTKTINKFGNSQSINRNTEKVNNSVDTYRNPDVIINNENYNVNELIKNIKDPSYINNRQVQLTLNDVMTQNEAFNLLQNVLNNQITRKILNNYWC